MVLRRYTDRPGHLWLRCGAADDARDRDPQNPRHQHQHVRKPATEHAGDESDVSGHAGTDENSHADARWRDHRDTRDTRHVRLEYPAPGDHHRQHELLMKVVVTNSTRQHAEVHYWRATKGDVRLDRWAVPFGGSTEIEVPSSKEDNQMAHVAEQCRT